jgi:PAS domain S-box-containing protein
MDAPTKRPYWQSAAGAAGIALAVFGLSQIQLRYPALTAAPNLLVVPAAACLLLGLLTGWRSLLPAVAGTIMSALWADLGFVDVLFAAAITTAQSSGAACVREFVFIRGGQTHLLIRIVLTSAGFAVARGLLTTAGWIALGRPDGGTVGLSAATVEWTAAVLFMPVLLIDRRSIRFKSALRVVEFVVILVVTAVAAQVVFSDANPLWLGLPFPVVTAFLALYAWAGVRFFVPGSTAVIGTVFAVLIVSCIARGTFAPDLPLTEPIQVQLGLLVGIGILVAVKHAIAAVAGDRHAGMAEVARLHSELQAKHAALQTQVQTAAEKNSFLEAVLGQLPAGVLIVGPDGRIMQRNERHKRMFETEAAAKLTDLPQGRMSTSGKISVPYDRWPIVRAIRDGVATDGVSVRMQLADGATGDFHLCAAPVRGPDGKTIGAVSVLTDVSERNKVLRQLRESEQKLRMALQAAHMTVAEWHQADGRFVNPDPLPDWFRLPPGTRLESVSDLLAFVYTDDQEALKEKVIALMGGKPQCETVFRVRGADDRIQWVLSRSLALTDDDGHPTGQVSSVLVDVTERYQQLDQLRLLESAVVHARDAVIILEDRPRSGGGRSVLYVNRAFTALSGYEAEEVVGRSLHLLRGPNSDPDTLDRLRDALDDRRPFQCELLNYRKDGTEFWVELSVVPVPDPSGNCTHWVMIQRDVSDRKRSDVELRTSREGLAEAQRIAHLGSWESVVSTGEIRWSDEKFRIFGYEPGEIVPTLPQYMSAVHPDDFPRVESRFQHDGLNPPRTPQQLDFRIVRPSGEVRYITEQYYAVCDDAGRATRFHGVTQDVTERRQAQEQLIQAQKMELIGQMAGGIAHDFNNVLTGLIGNLDLVKMPADDPNRRLIDTATKAAFRATDMTRKLLGFARKSQLRTAPVPLGPIVHEVLELVGRTTDPRIELRAAVRTAARVDGDSTLLSQVLLNLCLNARDAMPHGGRVEIRVDEVTLDDPVHHPAGRAGRCVRVSVEDNGIGIPPEVKEHMFEPFFTTKPVGEGTGLGLPMVHGIIEQHHGWVECHSEVGGGTRFDLFLPRCSGWDDDLTVTPPPTVTHRLVIDQPHSDRQPTSADQPKTILLVDDEEMIRELARVVLESGGYRVLEACDGEQAIEVYCSRSADIDLTILDLTMPRLSGQDTFRALVALDPDVRVLFSSGYSADTLADTEGALGLLPKPYRPIDLLEAVAAAVDSQLVSAS